MREREITIRWALPVAMLIFMLATRAGFGVFRDELYYAACGRHLAWGYVDHPPLIAWVARGVRVLAGESYTALRVVSALAAALTVFVVGDSAAALGGGRWARMIAQLLAATTPVYLSLFTIFSMNALDVLAWAACTRLTLGLLTSSPPRQWIALGAVLGIGLLNKVDVALFGVGLAVGVVLSRRFALLRQRELWIGAALALALFAPHFVWQVQHGWPTAEFIANARNGKIIALGPLAFLGSQVLLLMPAGACFALAGALWLLFAQRAAAVRPLASVALVPLAVFMFSVSKPYYYCPVYTLLFPAGAVAVAELRWKPVLLRALSTLAVLTALIAAPLAKPLLSEDATVALQTALGAGPATEEHHALGRLSQHFADMHGWRSLAEDVAAAAATLPAAERAKACFLGFNYGQAGAIEYYRSELALPPAFSGHNSYALWGPGPCTGEIVLLARRDITDISRLFDTLKPVSTHRCRDCLPMEDNLTIWMGRGLKQPFSRLKHFD